jgi:hypothetical protein
MFSRFITVYIAQQVEVEEGERVLECAAGTFGELDLVGRAAIQAYCPQHTL